MSTIEVPKFLQHLKLDDRGYPIPFFVPIVDGVPNFRYMDGKKLILAVSNKLCHICGKKLYKDYHYFISGPLGLHNQVSSDAAMHRECAEYSLAVCPHMLLQKARRMADDDKPSPVIKEKPDEVFLIKSDKYTSKFYPQFQQTIIHYRMVSAEKYIYINGRLTKDV